MDRAHVLIVGGGGTGTALAHDLTLRGLQVTLVERGQLSSGTSGRHHGLLHSGARYAVSDHATAAACSTENCILRRIAPGSVQDRDGLFVAVTDEDVAYQDALLDACAACGIPARLLTGRRARKLERGLSPQVRSAVQAPDAIVDAMDLPLRFAATAQANGAALRPYSEVTALTTVNRRVCGAVVAEHQTGRETMLTADLVVNAAGPWAHRVAALAGATVSLQPSPGALLAVGGRLSNRVISRLHPPGDGDVIVPHGGHSVIGASSWLTDDPDGLTVPADHLHAMASESARLLPAVAKAPWRAAWVATRPLVGRSDADCGRSLSRMFACLDHAVTDGVEGLVSIAGGTASLLRAMAEATADVVCAKLGLQEPCRTREVRLLPQAPPQQLLGEA